MILTIPKNRKQISRLRLAEITRKSGVKERTSFHTKCKHDYSAFIAWSRENWIRK